MFKYSKSLISIFQYLYERSFDKQISYESAEFELKELAAFVKKLINQ